MRILVVEDEPPIADFVERGLRAAGYAVTCAETGEQGEAEALAGDYDLVLLDLLLPGKGGLEVLEATSRRSLRSSSRSSLVRPCLRPSSTSDCSTQRRSDSGATPRSSATALNGFPLTR
jgi:CheY-like chemotaxis protein